MALSCTRRGSGGTLGKASLKRVVGRRHRLSREVVHSLSLEVFHNRVDVALRAMVSGQGGGRLVAGLGDLSGLFQPQ